MILLSFYGQNWLLIITMNNDDFARIFTKKNNSFTLAGDNADQ